MWQEELHQDLGAPSCWAGQTLPYCGGFECRTLCNTKRSRHYTIDGQRFLLCALHCADSGSQILLSLASLGADIYQDADTYSEEEEVSSAGLFCTMTSCREMQSACFCPEIWTYLFAHCLVGLAIDYNTGEEHQNVGKTLVMACDHCLHHCTMCNLNSLSSFQPSS